MLYRFSEPCLVNQSRLTVVSSVLSRMAISASALLALMIMCVLVTLYYLFQAIFKLKNLSHVPGPRLIPIVGNALMFTGDHQYFLPTMSSLINQGRLKKFKNSMNYPPVFLINTFLPLPHIMTIDFVVVRV